MLELFLPLGKFCKFIVSLEKKVLQHPRMCFTRVQNFFNQSLLMGLLFNLAGRIFTTDLSHLLHIS